MRPAQRFPNLLVERAWQAGGLAFLLALIYLVRLSFHVSGSTDGGARIGGYDWTVAQRTAWIEIPDAAIPMRDGKDLMADIWLPSGSGQFPTILMITPYNRKILGAALRDPLMKGVIDRDQYTFVFVDARGRFGSANARIKRIPFLHRTDSELSQAGHDGYDTVEWIAKQPWSNGKVGMWGPSALARIQYFTAAEQPPHLVCAVPMVSGYAYDYGNFYCGGVPKEAYMDLLNRVGLAPKLPPARSKPDLFRQVQASSYHPDRIDIPMLLITGWYDLYAEGTLKTFDDIRREGGPRARTYSKLLIGPWSHTAVGNRKQGEIEFPTAAGVSTQAAHRFFGYWLLGQKENGYDREPPVRYFQMGMDEWRHAQSFPPSGEASSVFFLHAGGKLSPIAPIAAASAASFRYDPKDPSPTIGGMNAFLPSDPRSETVGAGPRDQRAQVMSRSDYLSYLSDRLAREVDLDGIASTRLFVSSDQPDTDFAVRLCDVYPDGRVMLVTDGIHRMRYRESLEHEALMEPGVIYPVTVDLSVTAYTFRQGHQIGILVSSANYPRFAANPNTGRRRLFRPGPSVATNHVYHEYNHPSSLILPSGGVGRASG